jgi:phosphonate transport system substrate-binding protein
MGLITGMIKLLNAKAIAAILFGILLLGLCAPIRAKEPNTLVFGRVTSKPHKAYKRYTAILNYAVERMAGLGITKGKIELLPNNRQLIEYLKSGRVDWITETIYSALIYQKKADAQLLLSRWKSGRQSYRCVFITRKDSGIQNMADLRGKKLVLEDPGSTTGYFIPVSMLKEAGLEFGLLSSPRAPVKPNQVGYFFSYGELNIATLVHKGYADVGAYSDVDWKSNGDTPEAFRKDLKIIIQSGPLPRTLELVRNDLPAPIKQRLKKVLLNAHKDPEGKAALKAYKKTAKFEEISASTIETMAKYRQLLDKLNP